MGKHPSRIFGAGKSAGGQRVKDFEGNTRKKKTALGHDYAVGKKEIKRPLAEKTYGAI